MGAELFKDIKDTEKKADEIIAKAGKEKEKIVEEAKRKSMIFIKEGGEKINREREDTIKAKIEKIESLKEQILSKGKEEAKKLRNNSEKNISQAVNFSLDKFEELIQN